MKETKNNRYTISQNWCYQPVVEGHADFAQTAIALQIAYYQAGMISETHREGDGRFCTIGDPPRLTLAVLSELPVV